MALRDQRAERSSAATGVRRVSAVEASEKLDLAAAANRRRLTRAFPRHRGDLVHGRLDSAARAARWRVDAARPGSSRRRDRGRRLRRKRPDGDRARGALRPRAAPPLRGRVPRRRPGTWPLLARGGGTGSGGRSPAARDADGFAIAEAELSLRGRASSSHRSTRLLPDAAPRGSGADVKRVAQARSGPRTFGAIPAAPAPDCCARCRRAGASGSRSRTLLGGAQRRRARAKRRSPHRRDPASPGSGTIALTRHDFTPDRSGRAGSPR